MTQEQRDQLSKLFIMQAEAAYGRHRLRYAHVEDDGKSVTFVCICDEGFSNRRNWNLHIRDSFSEVPVTEEEAAAKKAVETAISPVRYAAGQVDRNGKEV